MPPNLQYIVLFHHFGRFLKAAYERGIDVAPLKGAHLLTSVYPEGEERGKLSDIDFLVRERDFERAQALLQEQGFEPRRTPGRAASDETAEDIGFYLQVKKGERALFELHRHLERQGRHPIDYDALWSRAGASDFDGIPCTRLSVEDHFLHSVIHQYTDRFARPQGALRDMELLLTRGAADLGIIQERAREWHCARATWLSLSLLKRMKPALPLAAAIRTLRPPTPIARALEYMVPDANGFRYAGVGMRREQALLWPLLMESPTSAVRFAASYAVLRIKDLGRG